MKISSVEQDLSIWKDKPDLLFLIFLAFQFVGLGIFLFVFIQDSSDYLSLLLLVCVSYMCYILLRIRLTLINKSGIRIGNNYRGNFTDIILKQKATFILWQEIKSLRLIRKGIYGAFGGRRHNILIITTKKGQTFESEIFQVLALKETLNQRGYKL